VPGGERYLLGEIINAGTITVGTFTVLWRKDAQGQYINTQHVNTGTIELLGVDSGLDIYLGGTTSAFTNSGTVTLDDATSTLGVINVSGTAGSIVNGPTGVLNGVGTVRLTGALTGINNGTIAPGLSPGTLTWLGSVPMGPTGRIAVELEGTTPGTGYDQLNASFDLVLNGNGTLDVTAPDFTPSVGDRLAVLTFASRQGNFATVNLPVITGIALDTVWVDTPGVDTLVIQASAGPAGPLTLGQVYTSTVSAAAEVDTLYFDASAGDIVEVLLASSGLTSGVVNYQIFRPTGAQVGSTFGQNSNAPFTLPETGRYRVHVFASDGLGTGSYSLALEGVLSPTGDAMAIVRGALVLDSIGVRETRCHRPCAESHAPLLPVGARASSVSGREG